jgi:hypothetical protein
VPGRRRSRSPGHEPRMPDRRPDRSGDRGFGAAPRVPRPGIRAGYRGSRSGTAIVTSDIPERNERFSCLNRPRRSCDSGVGTPCRRAGTGSVRPTRGES